MVTPSKTELYDGSRFAGKVKSHSCDEKLRVYDTGNDGDTFNVYAEYTHNGARHNVGIYAAPGTSAVMDYRATVDIAVHDGAGHTDYIAGARGTGGAVT